MSLSNKKTPSELTEHLFRNFYQEMFSSLIIKYGTNQIDLIEDALQETFFKALKSWKFNNTPQNQKGWLYTVTKNHILNELTRQSKSIRFDSTINLKTIEDQKDVHETDQLAMLLSCARFDLKPQAKIIFILKTICGFGVAEIANSLLISEENVYKQIQRGKKKLKALPKDYFTNSNLSVPSSKEIDHIEQIVYFMFNEGYDSINTSSTTSINKEICFEALRLAHLLEHRFTRETNKNLLALFYFHMARFDSRTDANGEFVSLRKQNRQQWDHELIQLGFEYLIKPKLLNRYYIEALIASLHSTAQSFKETRWTAILKLYDTLLQFQDTAIIRLNRAICLFELGDHEQGRKALNEIKDNLSDSYIYYSVSMAEYLEDKDIELSKLWYSKSLRTTKQNFRKELIRDKLDKLIKDTSNLNE